MHVRLSINEQGALRNQRYAFTNRYTLISELLQNARRAKASRVRINYSHTSRQLIIEDNGIGVADFQKLFTLNESGWDESTTHDEQPFGVGFSKCLYSASRCMVESLDKKIDFTTEDALLQHCIEVTSVEYRIGTKITLFDVDLPDADIRIKDICRGYALPVTYNGETVERPHAPDTAYFINSPIGAIHISGIDNGWSTHDTAVYLQGICVIRSPYFLNEHRMNIVHLDPSRFMARLPDRDKLIDEDEQRKLIDETLKDIWRAILLNRKQELTTVEFVDRYYDAACSWGHLDLFNDVPLLPKNLCYRIVRYPYKEGPFQQDYLERVDRHIKRDEVESCAVRIVKIDAPDDKNLPHWMYARACDCLVLSGAVDVKHWLHDYIESLDEEQASVEIIGESCRTAFEGRWIWHTVVLCEKYAITVGNDRIEISNEGLFDEPLILIPMHESSGQICQQVSSYVAEFDYFREDDLHSDISALSDLIRRLRAVDPQTTLESMIAELHLEKYPLLHGRTFQLTVGTQRQQHNVTLVT